MLKAAREQVQGLFGAGESTDCWDWIPSQTKDTYTVSEDSGEDAEFVALDFERLRCTRRVHHDSPS